MSSRIQDQPSGDRTPDGREIIRQRYPDGKVQVEREVAQDQDGNYFNHGLWRVFDRNENIVAQGEYKQGKMHGQWERKHSSQSGGLFATRPFNLFQSPFTSTASFVEGKLDGLWTISDAYERKVFEVPYRNGQRNGTATWWYPTMTKMREVTFKDGMIDGKLLEWDDQNRLTRDEEYYQGQKIVRNVAYYRPNQPESENYYRDAKLEVEGEDDWWEARPAPMVTSGQRVQHGPAQAWHSNGLPKMKGEYKNGARVGQFTWWHPNGNKQLEGSYENGQKQGRWIWRHANGMKAIEGQYEDDRPVGSWRWWDTEGKIEAEEQMSPAMNADPTRSPAASSDPDAGGSQTPADLPSGDSEPIEPAQNQSEDGTFGFRSDPLEFIVPMEGKRPVADDPATNQQQDEGSSNRDDGV